MKKIKAIISLILCVLFVLGLSSCGGKADNESETGSPEITEPSINNSIEAFTGKKAAEGKENARPVGIVVENLWAARPQWGITTPDVLMEYEVEGGITRMLWIYSDIDKVPKKVGPVRSARHDPVEIALGMDAIFVHNGFSYIAENLIKKYEGSFNNINGLYSPPCFYRDTTRNVAIEHTSCLDGDLFREYVAAQGISTERKADFTAPFNFVFEDMPRLPGDGACGSLAISYSASFNYTFTYDASTSKYLTALDGSAMVDENGEQCKYTNVVVLYVDMESLETASGHQDLKLENGGEGIYASGGTYERVKWAKAGEDAPLEIFSMNGEKLQLNVGNSYVGLVRSTQSGKTVIA